MKNNTTVRHILDRPQSVPKGATLANAGPMAPQQVRAMWAKRNDPQQASSSDRPYIPIPRVPVPGYEPKPPQTGTSDSVPVGREEPTAPRDPKQDIWDKINRIRQGLPPVTAQPLTSARDIASLLGKQGKTPPTRSPFPDTSGSRPGEISVGGGKILRDKYGRVIGGGTRVIGGVTVPGPQY